MWRPLWIGCCLLGASFLVTAAYLVYMATSDQGRQNSCGPWKCQNSTSCRAANLTWDPCPGDPTLVCCAPSNSSHIDQVSELSLRQSRRIPGLTADQKCREYGATALSVEISPVSLPGEEPRTVTQPKCKLGQPLVMGGEEADQNEFPHMASIGFFNESDGTVEWFCGGSLISELFILSAAHCNVSEEFGVALIGSNDVSNLNNKGEPIKFIIKVINHPKYKAFSPYHDIALLKLKEAVKITNSVRPICLDTTQFAAGQYNKLVIVTGWGYGEDQKPKQLLQKASIELYDEERCKKSFNSSFNTFEISYFKKFDSLSQICAGAEGKDTCKGDSGGPLQERHKSLACMYSIIGITSFGPNCTKENKIPAVYTRVSYYIEWIEDIVWPQ